MSKSALARLSAPAAVTAERVYRGILFDAAIRLASARERCNLPSVPPNRCLQATCGPA